MEATHYVNTSFRFFSWLTEFIRLIVRTTTVPEKPFEDLGIDPQRPICYVLRARSLSDLLVLEYECKKLGLPLPSEPSKLNRKDFNRNFIYLTKLGLVQSQRHGFSEPPTYASRLCEIGKRDSNLDVQIVPVSVVWGRNPGKEERSLFKLLFFDEEHAGLLQKSLIVLAQGRETIVKFGRPISLRQFLDEDPLPAEQATKKLRRILKVHFRKERSTLLGPVLYERGQATEAILATASVRQAIEDEVRKKGFTRERVEGKARHYVAEIAANRTYAAVRFLDIVLSYVWHKIFDGIDVRNTDQLHRIAEDHEIVYIASHRSHLDYLLMGYVTYHAGFLPPHTMAGVNLNFFPMGALLRRGGAFFTRRSFRGNRLYTAVFNEYVHFIITRGFALSFYPEGGRSRTGRLLQPKTGMIAMVMQSYLKFPEKPIAFVPVYIGYDKVMEARTYQRELRGATKRSESMGQLLKARRALKASHGRAYMSFAEPIFLKEYLQNNYPHALGEKWTTEQKPDWFSDMVENVARDLMVRINNAITVSPVSLFATALLATPQKAMTEEDLAATIEQFVKLLTACYGDGAYGHRMQLPTLDARAMMDYCERVSYVRRFHHPGGDVIHLEDGESGLVTYYRNNALHLFALPSLIASYFQYNDIVPTAEIVSGCQVLYPFLRKELFLPWPIADVPATVAKIIDAMIQLGFLIQSPTALGQILRPPVTAPAFGQLMTLGRALGQTLERYSISAALLSHNAGRGTIARDDLETQCQLTAQRISILSGLKDPDMFDKSLFQVYVDMLKSEGYVVQEAENRLRIEPKIKMLSENTLGLLSQDVRQTIQRTSGFQDFKTGGTHG